MIEVLVPDLGLPDGVVPRISGWLVRLGETVVEGDRLVELHRDEWTFDVTAPASGRLVQRLIARNRLAPTGAPLGVIEPE
jgi:pyruvate/2-oxoglutarate dehydrogenase complex dihydrolipoamide acyltransferase (E2) component